MASSLMACLVLAVALATTVTAQIEFNFRGEEYIQTREGQTEALRLVITRTGLENLAVNVTLTAYEVTDNYKWQWSTTIEFLSGEVERNLSLGVIDDEIHYPDRIYSFEINTVSPGVTIGARNRVYVGYADDDGPLMFDCRAGETCKNGGTCNLLTGSCICTMSTFADCSVRISDLNPSMCANRLCGPGGVCVTDGLGGTKCACQPGYGGDTCALQNRYHVKCFSDRMCLHVDPPPGYTGARYIVGRQGTAACNLRDVTPDAITTLNLPNTWSGSYLCLPHEDPQCGDVKLTTEVDGNTTRSREVLIRQNNLRTKYDILFTAHCKYNARGVLFVDLGDINTGTGLIFVTDTDYVTPASIFFVNPTTGDKVSVSSVSIGDEICFALVLDQGFAALRLENVIANDTRDEPETYEVLRNGCPVPGTVNVVSRPPWLPNPADKRQLYFCISAFMFDRTSKVGLRFETKICQSNEADCVLYTCPTNSRKKRETGGEDLTRYMVTTITVRDPRENTATSNPLILTPKTGCKLTSPIIASLAVLAVLAVVLLFALVLMCVRATRSRDK